LRLSQRTNFCLREPGTHTEIRLLWRGEGGERYKRILMEEEEEGLGKQTRMMMKRIMTQG
jgi:hypothetical protein